MPGFTVRLGTGYTTEDIADYTWDAWTPANVDLDTSAWTWTHKVDGSYYVEGDTVPTTGASFRVKKTAGGVPFAQGEIPVTAIDLGSVATLSLVTTLVDLVTRLVSAGAVATSAVQTGISSKLVYHAGGGIGLWDEVVTGLRSKNKVAYPPDLLLTTYNRALEEINVVLMRLGAPVAMRSLQIEGDGVNTDFTLPDDFQAPVPNQIRPRAPATATSNFTHGPTVTLADQLGVMTVLPTGTGAPRYCHIVGNATTGAQALRFDRKLTDGIFYDCLYFTKAPTLGSVAEAKERRTPWLGLVDTLIQRTMELYLREGLEFTVEAREAWRRQAENDALTLLGLRKVQAQGANPSAWRNLPRR